jgi:Periplasmic binding protein
MAKAAGAVEGQKFSQHFLLTEWDQVVDAWQLRTWDAYRDVARLGRKTRLPGGQRKLLWSIFERVQSDLRSRQLITWPELFTSLGAKIAAANKVVFDFAVVDEAQDISPSHLRFMAALGAGRPNALFFVGRSGPAHLSATVLLEVARCRYPGRSRTLRINYRTSHQIRAQADRLLGPSVVDVDGNTEKRDDTISVFNGPVPTILAIGDEGEEGDAVARWIAELNKADVLPHEFGVFVRSEAQLDRARAAVEGAGLAFKILDDQVETVSGQVSIATMHLAKGLEFRAVAVMACDDEISYDDAYSPPKTVEQARRLVESDEAFLIFASLGTATNAAIQKYMNTMRVPQLFVLSGASRWGDPEHFPWTIGLQPSYRAEARVYAAYILEHHPNARIGVLYQNDDFGRDYILGLKDVLRDGYAKVIVAIAPYETSTPTVQSQVVAIKAANPDVFLDIATPKFAAQAIKKLAELDWHPVHIVTNISVSVGAVLKPAGLDNARGLLSAGWMSRIRSGTPIRVCSGSGRSWPSTIPRPTVRRAVQ